VLLLGHLSEGGPCGMKIGDRVGVSQIVTKQGRFHMTHTYES